MRLRIWLTILAALGLPLLEGEAGEQQRVYIDPSTGQFIDRPTSDSSVEPEVSKQTGAAQPPVEPLREVVREDGSAIMDLRGRFRMDLKIRQTPDGSYEFHHESGR